MALILDSRFLKYRVQTQDKETALTCIAFHFLILHCSDSSRICLRGLSRVAVRLVCSVIHMAFDLIVCPHKIKKNMIVKDISNMYLDMISACFNFGELLLLQFINNTVQE